MSSPEDPLEECPDTGQPAERIIAGQPEVILDGGARTRPDDAMPPVSCRGGSCGL